MWMVRVGALSAFARLRAAAHNQAELGTTAKLFGYT
jgi:hypothetical protein